MPEIKFYFLDISFNLKNKIKIRKWLQQVAEGEEVIISKLYYFFCSDEFLLTLNKEFLSHYNYTDVITFDYSEKEKIEGEVYISIDRVKENANKFYTPFEEELHRLLVHGLLHLVGYTDSTKKAKEKMKKTEDYWLSLHTF